MNLGKSDYDAESIGLEISDLMMALVVVLILGIISYKDKLGEAYGYSTSTQERVNYQLKNTLNNVQGISGVEVLESGIVRFRGSFKHNESSLTEGMKLKLNVACKPIVDFVIKESELIQSVIFEGHSSDSWDGKEDTAYYGNQRISAWRASNTMKYCLGIEFETKYPELMSKFVAISYSYSRPVLFLNGSPNWKQSRRVDIKVLAKEIWHD